MSRDFTDRFADRAAVYSKYRPGYPSEILPILGREVGFSGKDIVADVGSGTGLLTRLFLENGNRVFGVEPNDEMRSYAEGALAGFRNFVSVRGRAERTTLPGGCVDLIAAGQALHWFDPSSAIAEFSRISKPGGRLCIVFNERKSDGFGRAYLEVVKRHQRDFAKVPGIGAKSLARYFKDRKYSKFEAPNEQSLDFQGLLGRLLSASYMPSPRERGGFEELRKDVLRLFKRFDRDGRVKLRYRTEIYIGRTA